MRDLQGMEENEKVHDEIRKKWKEFSSDRPTQKKCQENLNMKLLI
jgi:hypothetical protein